MHCIDDIRGVGMGHLWHIRIYMLYRQMALLLQASACAIPTAWPIEATVLELGGAHSQLIHGAAQTRSQFICLYLFPGLT